MVAALPSLPQADTIRFRLSPGREGTAETVATMARLAMGAWGAKSAKIRELALSIMREANAPGRCYRAEVEAIHAWVKRNIRYTRDPVGQERVQTPEQTAFIDRSGDCDDFSVLEAALLGALGHPTRFITIGFTPAQYSHVFLEANVRDTWIPLDPIKADKPAGWQAPGAVIRRAWPVNRAEGFDPYAAPVAGLGAFDLREIYGPLPDPAVWWNKGNPQPINPDLQDAATYDQRGNWSAAVRRLVASKGADADILPAGGPYGLLPDPAAWFRRYGMQFSERVPNWDAATVAQQSAFSLEHSRLWTFALFDLIRTP